MGDPGGCGRGRARVSLEPAGRRRLEGGLVVRSAGRHAGATRRLVHLLKYRAHAGAARVLAEPMAEQLDTRARVLVPVPRTLMRLWRYGIDPAAELARALGELTGLPVIGALWRPLWWPPRAGSGPQMRGEPHFRLRRAVAGAVLIDDVVTTGRTLGAAHGALGAAEYAVTATAAIPTPPPSV
jgi:predicted amidophosphoribosyltransferase